MIKLDNSNALELSIKKELSSKRSLSRNSRSKTVLSDKSYRKEAPQVLKTPKSNVLNKSILKNRQNSTKSRKSSSKK